MLAFVTSKYLFMRVDLGWPGSSGDVSALHYNDFMVDLERDHNPGMK